MIEKQDILNLIKSKTQEFKATQELFENNRKYYGMNEVTKMYQHDINVFRNELHDLETLLRLFVKFENEIKENDHWQIIEDAEKACGM